MKTGTSRASARRKSVFMRLDLRDRAARAGSDDSTSVAPSFAPRTALISRATAVVIGSAAFVPGFSIDSRTIPMRMPFNEPGAPEACACSA